MSIAQNVHVHNFSIETKTFQSLSLFLPSTPVPSLSLLFLLLFMHLFNCSSLCTIIPFAYQHSSPSTVSSAFILSLSEVRTVLAETLNPVLCDAGVTLHISPTRTVSQPCSLFNTLMEEKYADIYSI